MSGFGTSQNVLEWPSQSLDLNLNEDLWRDLKKMEKLSKYRCAKLVASY
jgi:hypothetical protein